MSFHRMQWFLLQAWLSATRSLYKEELKLHPINVSHTPQQNIEQKATQHPTHSFNQSHASKGAAQ